MIKIHFICTGNIYRSRLAEAYLNSKQITNIKVSSSGIAAEKHYDEDISSYALEVIKQNSLVPFMVPTWQKTTLDLVKNADIVIFMTKTHYDYVTKTLGFTPKRYEIWDIEDMAPEILSQGNDQVIKVALGTYTRIKSKVDSLLISLKNK